jgi:sugar/nucleoside kinase (ribokinase family)
MVMIIGHYDCPVFLDTKKVLGKWCVGADFIKFNEFEYADTEHTLADLGIRNKLIVTKGGEGAEYRGVLYPTEKCSVQDLSGAGDTFLAGLVHKYCETEDIAQAITFANEVASKVVQKQGVATI